jgi:hypothetical protein
MTDPRLIDRAFELLMRSLVESGSARLVFDAGGERRAFLEQIAKATPSWLGTSSPS